MVETGEIVDVIEEMNILSSVLREAGRKALQLFADRDGRTVETKSLGDFVSDADCRVELLIKNQIQENFPSEAVVGEEFGGKAGEVYWIVDPIDGTSNFLSGLPFWCISIARISKGVPELGGVYAPALDIMALGGPSYGFEMSGMLTGNSYRQAPCFGVGRNSNWEKWERHQFEEEVEAQGKNVVSYGSCALSLMFVSMGMLSGYREDNLGGLWDCAGGVALCRASGIPAWFEVNADGSVNVSAGSVR